MFHVNQPIVQKKVSYILGKHDPQKEMKSLQQCNSTAPTNSLATTLHVCKVDILVTKPTGLAETIRLLAVHVSLSLGQSIEQKTQHGLCSIYQHPSLFPLPPSLVQVAADYESIHTKHVPFLFSVCWLLSLVHCTSCDDVELDLLQRGHRISSNQAFVGLEIGPCDQHASQLLFESCYNELRLASQQIKTRKDSCREPCSQQQ